jgi:hypothetical protein
LDDDEKMSHFIFNVTKKRKYGENGPGELFTVSPLLIYEIAEQWSNYLTFMELSLNIARDSRKMSRR